jgi:hypothetical protein
MEQRRPLTPFEFCRALAILREFDWNAGYGSMSFTSLSG